MGDRLDLAKLSRSHRMRTVCANGRAHAEFSYTGVPSFQQRCADVLSYDDKQGCGPHTLEFHDNNGWFVPEVDA